MKKVYESWNQKTQHGLVILQGNGYKLYNIYRMENDKWKKKAMIIK